VRVGQWAGWQPQHGAAVPSLNLDTSYYYYYYYYCWYPWFGNEWAYAPDSCREVHRRYTLSASEVHGRSTPDPTLETGGSHARYGRCLRFHQARGTLADGVRSCPAISARGARRPRTYDGRARSCGQHQRPFPQVIAHVEVQVGEHCKTVGSAYVGSNPTPATRSRRSEPVTWNCVTGFYVQSERFIRPSAVVCGLCVGQFRPSASFGRE
jgi:hypothetical protein